MNAGGKLMPVSMDNLVDAAMREWERWGRCTWNCITGEKSRGFHNDDEDDYAQYILDNYVSLIYRPPITWPTVDMISGDNYAWSAVAISYFVIQGGFTRKALLPRRPQPTPQQFQAWTSATTKGEFPVSQAHADFIRWSIRARKDGIGNASYWGYRADEVQAQPDVGDLIGCPRPTNPITDQQALAYFERTGSYDSHTDLVVAKRAREVDVIGGNVRDSVTRKTLALNGAGQLADTKHQWFVVMKYRP